jgi:hypothetical protein
MLSIPRSSARLPPVTARRGRQYERVERHPQKAARQHPEPRHPAWPYLDWQFDGEDPIAVSRAAWAGSRAAPDANSFSFPRIAGFRTFGQAGTALAPT